nr:hypothetical protein [Mycoplasmopsis bovis]
MEKLLTHFDSSTAYKLYVIAILRCAYPKAVNRDLKFYYETSFMSELFKSWFIWIIITRLLWKNW